ncbi:MAG: TolB family protein [Aurantibacter sp.]
MPASIISLAWVILLTACWSVALAQPDTEIYVFDLVKEGNSYRIENPYNITYQNPGYDNQPHFSMDGEKLYYVSTKDGQTDIAQVELREYSWTWLTFTQGSEYSPTPIPNQEALSAILLEKDGTQLLWKYPSDQSEPSILVPDLKIGYHCWLNEHLIVTFVLGEPATLRACYLKEGTNHVLQKNIGRSLHKIPGQKTISYVSKEEETWWIKSLDPISGASDKIISTLPGSEDYAWAQDGTLFMGLDNKLYQFNRATDMEWTEVKSEEDHPLKNITRLAINPKGNKIAIVVTQ